MNSCISKFTLTCASLIVATLTWSKASADANNDFGVWAAVQAQGSITSSESSNNRWLWWMEGQGRFSNDASRLGQSIIRPGVGYKISDNTSLWAGYAWIFSSPLGRNETDEHRIWQQLSWGDTFSWGNLATRTRLEQRFLSSADDVGWRYRQLVKYTYPIFSDRFYLSLYDEIFININSTDWGANNGFGQNRVFAGVGVFVDPRHQYRFELGYLNQYIHREKSTDSMNHIISVSLSMRF